jgi:hypothetical protein
VESKDQAAAQRRELRELGARRQLADRLNGVRKEVHGALAKLPHEHTHLPTGFADQFFRRDPGRTDAEGDDSLETVKAAEIRIKALLADTAAAEARLAELKAEAEAEEKAAQERTEKEAEIAQLDLDMAELQTKRAELVSELDAA